MILITINIKMTVNKTLLNNKIIIQINYKDKRILINNKIIQPISDSPIQILNLI